MEITANPMQASLALGLASFTLTVAALGAAAQRGEITYDDVAEMISVGRKTLAREPSLLPNDPVVNQLAATMLGLVEQIMKAASAPIPPEGPH
jgi:hypothetical protein